MNHQISGINNFKSGIYHYKSGIDHYKSGMNHYKSQKIAHLIGTKTDAPIFPQRVVLSPAGLVSVNSARDSGPWRPFSWGNQQ